MIQLPNSSFLITKKVKSSQSVEQEKMYHDAFVNFLREGSTDKEILNELLSESVNYEKLEKSILSKSLKSLKTYFLDGSLNQSLYRVFNKLGPIIADQKLIQILAQLERPVKTDL